MVFLSNSGTPVIQMKIINKGAGDDNDMYWADVKVYDGIVDP